MPKMFHACHRLPHLPSWGPLTRTGRLSDIIRSHGPRSHNGFSHILHTRFVCVWGILSCHGPTRWWPQQGNGGYIFHKSPLWRRHNILGDWYRAWEMGESGCGPPRIPCAWPFPVVWSVHHKGRTCPARMHMPRAAQTRWKQVDIFPIFFSTTPARA